MSDSRQPSYGVVRESSPINSNTPLVVDLDGTLIETDLPIESAIAHISVKPLKAFQPLFWLTSGNACLKQCLAHAAKIDASSLPYCREVLSSIYAKPHARG